MYSGIFNVADFYDENQNMGLTNLEIFLYIYQYENQIKKQKK